MSKLLNQLEDNSISIIKETLSRSTNPVVLYSIGKDSSVLLHLFRKAFYPNKPKINFLHIDTVGKEDQDTHKRIPQYVTVHAFDEHFPQLMHAVEEGMKVPDYKIIVFFVTARLTQLNAEVFNLMGYNVLEIHSRKSQSYRTKTSDKFRNQSSVIVSSLNISRCLGRLITVSFL